MLLEKEFYKFLNIMEEMFDDNKVNELLRSEKDIGGNFSERWEKDIDHGFFHGFMVCFVVFLVEHRINRELAVSCLLHDILKTQGYSQDDHDIKLREFFPNLHESIYRHAEKGDADSVLIRADRLELKRFRDFWSWRESEYFEFEKDFSEDVERALEIFYDGFRGKLLVSYRKGAGGAFGGVCDMILDRFEEVNGIEIFDEE